MISSHLNNKNYNVNDAQIWTNQICDDVPPLPPRSSRTSPPSIRTSSSSPTASSCRRPTADSTSPAPASGTIRSTAPSPSSGTPPPSSASSTSSAAHSDLIHTRPIASSYHHHHPYITSNTLKHIIPYIIAPHFSSHPPFSSLTDSSSDSNTYQLSKTQLGMSAPSKISSYFFIPNLGELGNPAKIFLLLDRDLSRDKLWLMYYLCLKMAFLVFVPKCSEFLPKERASLEVSSRSYLWKIFLRLNFLRDSFVRESISPKLLSMGFTNSWHSSGEVPFGL